MYVTVAICTWNRSKLLNQALAQMTKLVIPNGNEWELLIINNNCTDDTDDIIRFYSRCLPIIRLFEPMAGLSHARNLALRRAKGELILWTDDDVLVDPNWLSAYVSAANEWRDAVYFGGMIEPWYEITPQPWILENLKLLEGLLVIRNLGTVERPFVGVEQPWGANMVFRRDVFNDFRFNPQLGRQGNQIIVGEETELLQHLRAFGLQGIWVPGAKVRHFVPADRLSRMYVWRYFQGTGRTHVRMQGRPEGKLIWGVPRWLFRLSWELQLTCYWRRILRKSNWLEAYINAAQVSGMIQEVESHHR